MFFRILIFISLLSAAPVYAQTLVKGTVREENGIPLELASVGIAASSTGTFTGSSGNYQLLLPGKGKYRIKVSFLGYKTIEEEITIQESQTLLKDFTLQKESRQMKEVEVKGNDQSDRFSAGSISLNPKNAVTLPSPFNDFNKLLATLPGVVSNNELSSTYNVRGGNYDENQVYVNGIEIYRPFLVKQGQQEGLSFVNPNLASEVEFSTGGWQAKYGDKLSSVMNIKYKEPTRFGGSASAGLLGATFHLEGATKDQRVTYVVGFRYKNSRYILNTLPVQGQYFPSFYDLQSYVTIDLTNRSKKFPIAKRTTLGILTSYARNRYSVTPQTQQATFGTQNQILNLTVAFDGDESMNYDTYQGGMKLTHWFSTKVKGEFFTSGVDSREREYEDVEAGYLLSDLGSTGVSTTSYNHSAGQIGIGSFYNYARNSLHMNILAAEHRGYYYRNSRHTIQWGTKVSKEIVNDRLWEYGFTDSADYVTLQSPLISQLSLNTNRINGYIQSTWRFDSSHTLTIGSRIGDWSLNHQLIVSPSVQYGFKPNWKHNVVFRYSAGIYRQPPVYRELRNFAGQLNPGLKAQSSFQAVAGADYRFTAWGREFKFVAEMYYKYLWDVIPYEFDNIYIRYYALNDAVAYATGLDLRVNGEFIKGAESWFSLGLMQTEEKVQGDSRGYIRRPADQPVTVGAYFQDHIFNNPSIKAYLNMIYGSGLPFGPPNNPALRDAFVMPSYKRVDVGFSKLISFKDKVFDKKSKLESIWISLEVLNIIGANNTMSYLWIQSVNNQQFAVPNTLSQRFYNLRILVGF